MCYYNQYTTQNVNVIQQPPTYNEDLDKYTVICITTHTLSAEDLRKASDDAQSNIVALDNYDTVVAKQEFEQIVNTITTAIV